jgi:hypothetical protein
MKTKEEICKLKQDLAICKQSLWEISEEIKRVKDGHYQVLEIKEKEIQDLSAKLQICQQKRDQIQQELDSKIEEIKNSHHLTNENKTQQITNLLVEHKKELDLINQELAKAWSSCATQKDQIILRLTQSCKTCEHQSQTVEDLTKVRNWLIGVVSLLLLLLYRSRWPKKPKKNLKYDNLTRISK